ncbi:hypothetical protein BCR35DRAFT_352862 [Leucosporidium creatinivorum]|uniref:F-box domain-containing protein n=1 Tax=Leucosporidium creatinivorum TaxID=106004 RepID=A0A1Y2F7L3_9BASI|nr:hypothetical protein BCR35DRAFT_352862 [Leucosporidium creatinivorum]
MTHIDHLPAELLNRILELAAASITFYDNQSRASLLGATSLVASAWRAASQRLLFADVKLRSKQGSKKLLGRLDGLCSPPTIERLQVEESRHIQQLALRSKGLRALAVVSGSRGDSGIIDLDAGLVSRLRSLTLETKTPFSIPPLPSSIHLTQLSISSTQPFFPTALNSLLRASTSLSELHLRWDRAEEFPSPRLESLEAIAAQLHTLHLIAPPPAEDWPTSGHSLSTFLPRCTSLKNLHLSDFWVHDLENLLRILPSKLHTLETSLWMDEERGEELAEQGLEYPGPQLIAALKLPPLSELKRWRFEWSDWVPEEGSMVKWEALLKERAVELRDRTRFFTDYPSASP